MSGEPITIVQSMRNQSFRVAVIGGGIAGLAAAYRLQESAPQLSLTLFEASEHVGGILQTVARDGFLIERSADSFITDPPYARNLCERIGLAEELLPTSSSGRQALVVRAGRLLPVPKGFVIMAPRQIVPLLQSPLLSVAGRLRVLAEPSIPPRADSVADESVAAFARRRFGMEAYARLIQPLVGGIYTGDPERLSMAATLPRFWEAELKHGSIRRGMRSARRGGASSDAQDQESGARYSMFVAPRGGMGRLADAIVAALPAGTVRLGHRVTAIRQASLEWLVAVTAVHATGEATKPSAFDALILAVPASTAADLLADTNQQLAGALRGIESAGAIVACMGYRREQVSRPLDAFGFVVPRTEGRQILAGSISSNKFADRAPPGSVLLRIFLGGALQPELVGLPDDAVLRIVDRELNELLGVTGAPQVVEIARWYGAMPQYHVGHLQRVDEIERLAGATPGLALAGNAYRGVGIAQCVRSGELAAMRVLALLHNRCTGG